MRKVIVIGLDGLEPKIVDAMLAAQELPNLDALRRRGGYSRVATTTPAQTPVAWSTFATGTNPGGHGIFDFLRRDPRTYLPDISLNRYESRGAFAAPRAVNLRRGTPIWELLDEAGIHSTVLRCPGTYPPDSFRGKMLSGMGVPDLRGGFGTPTFYTTNHDVAARESESVVPLHREADGSIKTHLIGPRHGRERSDLLLGITLHPDPDSRRLILRSAGAPKELAVGEGQWSDWLRVKFKPSLFQSIAGLVRFHLVRLDPVVEFYASPINFDVEAPLYPISHPPQYAAELAGAVGLYHTTGMVEDHTGLNNERIGEEAFLDQCNLAWQEREAMMLHELKGFDQGLFYCLFDTPDRVQHMFWRFGEPDHPANRGRPIRPELAQVVREQYRRGDAVVGKALEFADDETLVMVLSDHGFGSFRRGVNLNTLLCDLGLLTLRPGTSRGEEAGPFFRNVDWSRTKAYALGLSGIYLNIEGREGQGTVKAGEAEALKAAIAEHLSGLVDSTQGSVAIQRVRAREAVYSGPFIDEAPDLLVDFAAGYRVSWGSSLGGVAEERFEDNVKKWSGDHIVDPLLVPGVLFMNRPFRATTASLTDLAPTTLDALGVPKGPAMQGTSLL